MHPTLSEEQWPYILSLLPEHLDMHAHAAGALRRARGVKNAEQLLRLFLAYGLTTQPLKGVVAWAQAAGVASISAPALFYRLKNSVDWLSQLLAELLSQSVKMEPGSSGYRLRIADATYVCSPGAKGIDWRVHVSAEPATGRFTAVEVTGLDLGEGLKRHRTGPGDLILGDRAYGRAPGIAAAVHAGADLLVRITPGQIRLCDPAKQLVDLRKLAAHVPAVGATEFNLLMPEPPARLTRHKSWPLKHAQSWTTVRVVAARTKKGNNVWILTTAPVERLDAMSVLGLYRLRWQIELLFKRLKSLLSFSELPAKTEPVVRAWILARLLAAALIQRLFHEEPALSPWGYRIRTAKRFRC